MLSGNMIEILLFDDFSHIGLKIKISWVQKLKET